MNRIAATVIGKGIVFLMLSLGAAGADDDGINWCSVDGGGGEMFSVGGNYELNGTIGQGDAGEMAGGRYGLTGGFWFPFGPGDCDADDDTDLDDYGKLKACLAGPGSPVAQECNCLDLNDDGNIDLKDLAGFQNAFGR